ncbi:MAG: HAMP domain-containing histidine kinase [Thermoflexibacter sp.]|jgi:signal transduction histidine kinase|nr:HAMP domain-containing histidine kinase [Thermoflexibacter sp.]
MLKSEYHRLLKRQINKYLASETEQANLIVTEAFLDAVNEAYLTFETDYKQLDRTLEISSEELFKANQNLKKVNEELDRFVYSASHDLKAPLSSLLGLIKLFELDLGNIDHTQQYLKMMQDSIHRLTKVIHDLADFSRNERLEIKLKRIDFQELVQEIVDSLRFIPNVDKINFKVNIKEHTKEFYSDLLRIRIMLNNLITNAILYHNLLQNTPLIIIDIFIDDKKGSIEILDNGRGIAEEHHKKIFDMFYRASEDSKGSGLGLYIVKGIVDKLQGELILDSEYGSGTIFSIEIPNMAYRLPQTYEKMGIESLNPNLHNA